MKNTLKKLLPSKLKTKIKGMLFDEQDQLKIKISTSISDNQIYPNFCLQASTHMEIFAQFRRHEVYRQILEHVSPSEGKQYLSEIQNNYPELLTQIELFKENDFFGNPEIAPYEGIGNICPSTLRYIKVYGDLKHYFGTLNDLQICEIGVGYGGQCRIINSDASPKEYTLVDIKPALMLAQCFLDNYILKAVAKYKTMNELETQKFDLLISNYAFTELPRNIQDVYLKKAILQSKRGYITYNDISPDYFKSYKKEELLKIIPHSRIIEEIPLTHEKNCIIIWGDENHQ